MESYIAYSVVIIMIGITASRNRVVIGIVLNAITLNRYIHIHCTPFSTTIDARIYITFQGLPASKMVCITIGASLLCYPLSCSILLMILVNYIAHGDGSPPAKFTRIIFVYLSLSSHWHHLLALEFPYLFSECIFLFRSL